ncbi:MAG: tRNA (adenosine(37)-N6)-threonylcarbamoyltransferase complex dimerization subunit type 1 TsaB [Lachnospiraceae bacterium]|jgi:tRNA threonylcarbamoyladenosine biosynthesis protein TsaB|nr:tRNA (adenosine(37)-N6)-threonylcarbamoyltransferase complex dimerization subunit type 1 TsaB [Lachnospiraceae bacterium]
MKILAVDSSGLVASVAVVEEDTMLAEYTVNYKKTHSQTLLPMLHEIVQMIELDLHSVDAIAVSAGPGSFTGLRIGSATAKGLGLALQKPIISIPTVEGLAYNLVGTNKLICPIMDARRNQVYTGLYQFEGQQLLCLREQCAVSIEEIIDCVNEQGRTVIFLGDGILTYGQNIEKGVTVPYEMAPAHMNRQRAGSIAALAFQYGKRNKMEDAKEHIPNYIRPSQAERMKRKEG